MARNRDQAEATENTEATAAEGAEGGETAAAEAAPKSDSRHKKVTLNADAVAAAGYDQSRVGEQVNRADWIRDSWAQRKLTRGEIKKVLNGMGDGSPYQIVFAATKGREGGPAKVESQPAGNAAPAEAASAE